MFSCCRDLIGATSGYVALSNESCTSNEVVFLETGGFPCAVDPNLPMPIRGMREVACRSGQTVYSNDFSASPWADLLPSGHTPLENVLMAPLVLDGKTIGVLGLSNKPGGFTDEDARRATQFANLAANVLHLSRVTESLEQAEGRFRAVSDGASDAIVAIDGEGRVRFWNRAAEAMFGASEVEVIGAPFSDFIVAQSREVFSGRIVPCPETLVLHGRRRNGQEFPIEFRCAGWDARKRGLCTAIIRDATAREREEQMRNAAQRELERQVRERTADLLLINRTLQQEIAERERVNAQLEVERANLRRILDSMQDGVTIIGPRHDVQYVNPALERAFGAVGDRPCYEYFHHRADPCPWCRKDEVVAGNPARREWRDSASGRTYDVFLTPLQTSDGQVSELSILHDVTERKRIEDALRESQRLIERIADTTPDILYVYDYPKRSYIYMNKRVTDALGYPRDAFTEDGDARIAEILHPEDREVRAARLARVAAARDGEVIETEYRIRRAGSEFRWFRIRDAVFSRAPDGAVRQIVGLAHDVTDLKRVERSIVDASEAERRRIGQDLHDGLGQVLAGVALLAKRLERQVDAKLLPAPEAMRQLVGLIVDSMEQSKRLAAGLFPIALQEAGLREALADLARSVTAVCEVSCVVVGSSSTPAMAQPHVIHLFRVAQEAVNNAVRHGRAKNITITLREKTEETVLEIADDGVGISDKKLQSGGMGLHSMAYRARLIGASFDIRRGAEGGTIVTCRVGGSSGAEAGGDEIRIP